MHTHKVVRSISGPTGVIPAGTLVNASNWKNLNQLLGLNRLMTIDEPIAPTSSEGLTATADSVSFRKRKRNNERSR